MVHLLRIGVLLPTVLVAVSGCATEDWVRDLMDKKDVEINQRMDGLGNRIKTTDQLARSANERADAAKTRAESVDGRLTRLWSNRYKQKVVDTVEIYFAFAKADLSEGAQVALLGVVKELEDGPTLVVRLRGFSDPTGARDYNYGLVQRRVEAVWRFLETKGVELSRVQEIRMGPLDDRGIPEEKRRRVTVTVMADED
jgi:outer membrane protein OmpA-like peptidoglycan-associated protein